MYKRRIRPRLFRMFPDAEDAHEWVMGKMEMVGRSRALLALVSAWFRRRDKRLEREVFGVRFPNPIGVAGGFDKNGRVVHVLPALGFGSVEAGTVTMRPQVGNDRPRLFRLEGDEAIVNRMGFNNDGSLALATRLRALREAGRWPTVPVGANIGKSKVTPNEIPEVVKDYVTSTRHLRGLVDWFTVNVSSPNTPGLRDLQDRDALSHLLPAVIAAAESTPVLLKLAPDLEDEALAAAVELARELGVSGIIATNTTLRRDMLRVDPEQTGGLSGQPLWPIARKKIQVALDAAAGRIPVIGVGGVSTADQVIDLLEAGCAFVQLYTAFIYEGPSLPSRLNRGLGQCLDRREIMELDELRS